MRIGFFGTSTYAEAILRAIAPHVVLAVSQPDRKTGRGMRLQPSPVTLAAEELGIQVAAPARCREPEFVAQIEALDLDLVIVAAYGQILPRALLQASRQGAFNLHASILPAYRGAAPIQRCILDGHSETGVSLMLMDEGMDTGPVIAAARTPIGPEEDYGELHDRLAAIAAEMTRQWLPRLATGDFEAVPQPEEGVSMAPKIAKAEAQLSFDRPAEQELRRCRAFTPSPGAFFESRLGNVRVIKAKLCPDSGEPGTWAGPGVVCFSAGSLELLRVRPEGKKEMSGRDFANGVRWKKGESLR